MPIKQIQKGSPSLGAGPAPTTSVINQTAPGTSIYSVGTGDFTITNAGGSKLVKIVNPGFTITPIQIINAFYYDASGNRYILNLNELTVALNGVDYDVTFAKKATNFDGTEVLEIYVISDVKGYDIVNGYWNQYVQNQINTLLSNEELANVTNQVADTYSYEFDPKLYNRCTLLYKVDIGSANSFAMKMWAKGRYMTDWVDVSLDYFGAASITSTATDFQHDDAHLGRDWYAAKVEIILTYPAAENDADWHLEIIKSWD